MQELSVAAYWLADEVRDGKWDHIPNIKVKPVPACPEMIDELRKRCPGYTVEQYQQALARGLSESR